MNFLKNIDISYTVGLTIAIIMGVGIPIGVIIYAIIEKFVK